MSGVGRFQKGQSGNPGGRPKADSDLSRIRNMTKEQLKEVLNLILSHPREELDQILSRPGTPFLIEWAIHLAYRSAEKGDVSVFREWMDRIVGKTPDKVEHGFEGFLEQVKELKALSTQELILLAQKQIEHTASAKEGESDE